MAKTKKTLWAVLLLWLIMSTLPAYSNAGPITKLFLKSGSVIECDMVWEGVASQILCDNSGKIIAYSVGDVDLVRTFGQSSAAGIAKRYEAEMKKRELMSKPTIVTPEQEKWRKKQTLEREQKSASELKAPGITEELIQLEKRRLKDKLESLKEKHRTASGPPPPGRSGFNEREWYSQHIERVEKEIEELERDPALYFYKKNH
jgi:hypothetical protein